MLAPAFATGRDWGGTARAAMDHPADIITAPIAAILYGEREHPDGFLAALARAGAAAGLAVTGVVQRDEAVPGRRRCDMHLDIIGTGISVPISEYRGEDARGCRLDLAGLSRAIAVLAQRIAERRPDLLIVNKFGKTEAEGGGLRDIIAAALTDGIPILIGIPARNRDAWRTFAGDYALEAAIGDAALRDWLTARGLGTEAIAAAEAAGGQAVARVAC